MNSGHIVEVISLEGAYKHPDADSLSCLKVDAYQLVFNTEQWKGVTKAAYVKADSVVNTLRPEFNWLAAKANKDGLARIKPTKLRGIYSYGIMATIPDSFNVGDDVTSYLEVQHYTPEEKGEGGSGGGPGGISQFTKAPELIRLPSGDPGLEHLQKYYKVIPAETPVILEEKVDGSLWCGVYTGGNFHIRSSKGWKREFEDRSQFTLEYFTDKGKTEDRAKELLDKIMSRPLKRSEWWEALYKNEPLKKLLTDNPDTFVFGELFGNTNRIKYQIPEGNRIAVFDVWKEGKFYDSPQSIDLAREYNAEFVPIIDCNYMFGDVEDIINAAEGKSLVPNCKAGTIREGLVVKPLTEMYHAKIGRVALKIHSPSFLLI